MFDPNIQIDPLELELIEVNSNNINYLQRTVSEIRVFDVNNMNLLELCMLMDSLFLMIIEDTYFCTKCTIRQIKSGFGKWK